MYFDYSVLKNRWLYPVLKPLLKLLAHIVYDISCSGSRQLSNPGGLIVACNHVAFSDPVLILVNTPFAVHFMAKSELFEKRLPALIYRNMNAFPVKRASADRNALRYALRVLKHGKVVGIFPEGRRVREQNPSKAMSGVGYIAYMSGADVLPCSIYKTRGFLRTKVYITFGKVIKSSELGFEGKSKSEAVRNASEIIMNRIKDLWQKEKDRLQ